jgi:vitamin B12 transporter
MACASVRHVGLTAMQDLPVELIERIEIVRGPRSSLYGSEAIGGVIQVFTRRSRDGVSPHLKLGGGSNDLREANGGIDIGFARGWFGVDYNHQSSDGINACSGAGFPIFAGCFMDNPDPDRDGYENNAISLRAGAKPTDTLTIEAQALRAVANNAYDADPAWGLPDESDTVQQVVGGKLRYVPNAARGPATHRGRNLDSSDNSLDGAFHQLLREHPRQCDAAGRFRRGCGPVADLGLRLAARSRRGRRCVLRIRGRARQSRRIRAVPGCVRRARPAGQRAPRRQRPVRRPQHRRLWPGAWTSAPACA